ncbi:MAG: hypothetical protein ACTH0C_12865 [Actinomycetaceae bacterium]
MNANVSVAETQVVIDRVLDAPVDAIWRVLSTPALHAAADASEMVRGARQLRPVFGVGDTFEMDMQRGETEADRYTVINTVVAYAPRRTIAWEVGAPGRRLGWTWRYDLRPVGKVGTRTAVRLTYDWADADPEALASIGRPMPAIPPPILVRGMELLEVEAALLETDDDAATPPEAVGSQAQADGLVGSEAHES